MRIPCSLWKRWIAFGQLPEFIILLIIKCSSLIQSPGALIFESTLVQPAAHPTLTIMKFLISILIIQFASLNSYSQDTTAILTKPEIIVVPVDTILSSGNGKTKEIRAIQIEKNLDVDGKLNEPEWSLAAASPHFIQIEPDQGKPALFETKVKVLYN